MGFLVKSDAETCVFSAPVVLGDSAAEMEAAWSSDVKAEQRPVDPGYLFFLLGDHTTQLYRQYDKTIIRIPMNQSV